jgi:hypothetical protein
MHVALRFAVAVVLAGHLCVTAGATTRTEWHVHQPVVINLPEDIADDALLKSLREDIDRHPDDFVTFTTRVEASRFLEQHASDARYETQQRMRGLGVLGYWQGRTIVVLPLVTRRTRGLFDPANLR